MAFKVEATIKQGKTTLNYRDSLIHLALTCLASKVGAYEIEYSVEELAHRCGLSLDTFSAQFCDIETLLNSSIDRMQNLFIHTVQHPLLMNSSTPQQRVTCFLENVRNYFHQYAEAGYLFTMSFFGSVLTSKTYERLETFFSLWHKTLYDCLIFLTQSIHAKRIAEGYVTVLRGQLQLANIQQVSICNLHAERYLCFAMDYLTNNATPNLNPLSFIEKEKNKGNIS